MKTGVWIAGVATVGTAVAAVSRLTAQTAEPAGGLDGLNWLAGQWYGTFEDGHWEASYTTAEGGVILSSNKELKKGHVAMIEFEHFFVRDGKTWMVPYPHGRKSKTEFELVELDASKRRAVFTADNDFPARIVYHRIADERLVIDLFKKGAPDGSAGLRLDLKKR